VRRLFAATVNEILALKKTLPKLDEGVMYSFDGDTVQVRDKVEALLRRLHAAATAAVERGIKTEWSIANSECDELVRQCFGKKLLDSGMFRAWTSHNEQAMRAFIKRSDKGLNLSERIWQSTRQLRDEMEMAMTVGIGEGQSAAQMSRTVRKCLNDPDLMFRRFRYKKGEEDITDPVTGEVTGKRPVYGRKWKKKVRDEKTGGVRWIDYDRDSYRTGRGVYKSSAKNAMRVTRTETNMAYRNADYERWQKLDFVLGIHISLSRQHPVRDICDDVEGDYPKDFKFVGWHPQCFCYATPILVSEDEMAKVTDEFLKGKKYIPQGEQVMDTPAGFKAWVENNSGRMRNAKSLPYWVQDNPKYVDARKGVAVTAQPKSKEVLTVDEVLGVRRGNPMSFEAANELRGNPHYSEDKMYRINCQSCVVANELRRRGFDVEAYGNSNTLNYGPHALSYKTEAAWLDKNGRVPVATIVKREVLDVKKTVNARGYVRVSTKYETDKSYWQKVEQAMSETGRYHISWQWKKKKSGHIITAERLSDGKLRFYDPQTGKLASYSLKDIDTLEGFDILRVDNLQANPDVVKYVVKKAGTSGSAPKMDKAMREWWKENVGGYGVTGETSLPEEVKQRRKEIRRIAQKTLLNRPINLPYLNKTAKISNAGVKEWLNQPFANIEEKNEALLRLSRLLQESSYVGYGKDKHDSRLKVHLFKTQIGESDSWIIVRENEKGSLYIHSISDNKSIVEKVGIKKGSSAFLVGRRVAKISAVV